MASEHAKAFSALPDVVLSGIFSRTRTRAEQLAARHPGMLICNSVTELFERTRADLVVVTVKELAMESIAIESFAFPWTVLLEKPAGHDFAVATRVLEAATKSGCKAYVALNRRAYSSTRSVLHRLSTNAGLRFVKVIDQQDQEAASQIYNEPFEVVKNYMYANSIHLVDLFHVFCRGELTESFSVIPWIPEKPWLVVSKLAFSSGDIGLYEGIWDGPGPWSVSVSTPAERYEMRPLEQATVQLRGERKATAMEIDSADVICKPGLLYQASQAVAAARGEPHNLPSLQDSWQSMHLVARIFSLS